ncbi:MAG: magnesium/cobalt transporter CorA [Actinomycetota bacterium]|nr:magnesium/cobalt transporter CorA [Actinomycetota bacterium]
MTMSVRVYGEGDVKEIDPADISDVITEVDRLVWVDMVDPTEDDLHCLQEEFSLHPLAIEDVCHRFQRPKLEKYPDHSFLVAYSAGLQEIDFFVGPNWVISAREVNPDGSSWSVEAAHERFNRIRRDPVIPGFLLYVLLDDLVDGYFDAADKSEEVLEDLEERIFDEARHDEREIQEQLFDARRQLVRFRRAIVPLRDVVGALMRREVPWVDESTAVLLQDVYDHVLRVIDLFDARRELISNAVDAHLAIISNHMNGVMKKMTSWGAILLCATLVASIYGMNFEHLPARGWVLGFPYALGLMGVITLLGYWYFSRKDWL